MPQLANAPMPTTTNPKPKPDRPDPDVFRVVLQAPDHQRLAELVRRHQFDLGPVRRQPDRPELEADLFLTREQIAELERSQWRVAVRENLSEVGRARQKEVGKGDRFEGGKIAPKGLGRKTRR